MCFAPQRRALFRIWTSKSGANMWCFVHFDFEMCFAPQRRALFRHRNFQKWSEPGVFCTFWLQNVLRATTACTFSTSQLSKVVREWCVLYILTSKCASRHNGVHFFDIATSKSGPRMVCFVHFDFEMCFAPQRRALFRHLNFQKWSEPPQFLTHFTSKCASRHNGVQLFISHLPRCLRTRRFSEPTFQPSGATKPRKNTVFRDFLPFRAPASSFFWSFLFWLFSLLTAFSSLHIVGSLTSKLPSIIPYHIISYTSSTAQGGGRSFKNRKPIGEECCCGAKMAERSHWLTERWLCVFFWRHDGARSWCTQGWQACNELQMLPSDHVQWITAAAAPSCGQKKHTRWPAINSDCCSPFVPSDTATTFYGWRILGFNDFKTK